MNGLTISLAVAGCVFAGGIAGLHLHRLLPTGHMSKETQDVVRLTTGMLSVLASLVLGLLIATVKSSFDAMDGSVRSYGAELILLDETLRDYGDGALQPRRMLRDYTAALLHDVWDNPDGQPFLTDTHARGALLEHVRETIRALKPIDDGQRWLMDQALQTSVTLMRQRWLLVEQGEPTVRPLLIVIVVSWISVIFVSFGLNAPRNRVVIGFFLIGAMAIGAAMFIILELDTPLSGAMRISDQPIRTAVEHMLPAGH